MNISSVQSYPSLLEQNEHSAGCQCPGCCKGTSLRTTDTNSYDSTIQDSDETSLESSKHTQGERQELMQLQQRDSEVRSHEAAHMAAGGSVISGSASFTYQKGPDGRLYAVGGEVPISSSGGNTPEETIAIARQIQAGALAPANPSPQDLKVASSAAMMEAQAKQDLAIEKSEEQKSKAVNMYSENQDNLKQNKGSSISARA